jgi:hypothetical protein
VPEDEYKHDVSLAPAWVQDILKKIRWIEVSDVSECIVRRDVRNLNGIKKKNEKRILKKK